MGDEGGAARSVGSARGGRQPQAAEERQGGYDGGVRPEDVRPERRQAPGRGDLAIGQSLTTMDSVDS